MAVNNPYAFRHIFGLKSDVNSNVHFTDDHLVLYPAGHNTVIFNMESKVQKFIHGAPHTDGISAIAVSPSRRYVAVAEKTGDSFGADLADRFLVNIYDLNTLKRRKKLQASTEITAKGFISMCFSADNKTLLT